jgi:hypothetical protein
VREAAVLADDLGDVLLTYACNRLVENRVAADRVVSHADAWLRDEGGDAEPALGAGLWRRLAAARASRDVVDEGILGSLLDALGLADTLASGPGAALRDGMDALAGGSAPDAAATSAAAVRSAGEALDLVRRIGLHLQEWESLHEILEATRSLLDQQDAIRRNLRGPAAPGAPEGR